MTARTLESAGKVEDRKSVPLRFPLAGYRPGQGPDLEQRLRFAVSSAPDRPVIEVVGVVPLIRAAPPGLRSSFVDARDAVLLSIPWTRGRGRPRRNAYLAAEVAYMVDLDRKPLVERPAAPAGVSSAFAYLRPDERALWYAVDRTMRRWLRDGRATLAALGAFPWAMCDRGVLPRRWWREDRFDAALVAWTQGRRAYDG